MTFSWKGMGLPSSSTLTSLRSLLPLRSTVRIDLDLAPVERPTCAEGRQPQLRLGLHITAGR